MPFSTFLHGEALICCSICRTHDIVGSGAFRGLQVRNAVLLRLKRVLIVPAFHILAFFIFCIEDLGLDKDLSFKKTALGKS